MLWHKSFSGTLPVGVASSIPQLNLKENKNNPKGLEFVPVSFKSLPKGLITSSTNVNLRDSLKVISIQVGSAANSIAGNTIDPSIALYLYQLSQAPAGTEAYGINSYDIKDLQFHGLQIKPSDSPSPGCFEISLSSPNLSPDKKLMLQ